MDNKRIKSIVQQDAWRDVEEFFLSKIKPYEPKDDDSNELIIRKVVGRQDAKQIIEDVLKELRSMVNTIENKNIETFK